MERDGEVGKDRRVRRLTARKIDGSRRVDRDDRNAARPGLVDQLDRGSDRLAKGSADARAKKGVNEDGGLLDPLAEHRHIPCDRKVDLRYPLVLGDAVPVTDGRRAFRPGVRGDDCDDDIRTVQREPPGTT